MRNPPSPRNSGHAARLITWIVAAGLAVLPLSLRAAEGIYGSGADARSMGMGGTEVANPGTALSALGANPAGLSLLTGFEADAGFDGAAPYGRFTSKTGQGGTLSSDFTIAPEGAIAVPIPSTPLTVGFGVVPQIGLDGHWNYPDPPGGLGGTTSYGQQRDNSEIQELRLAFGLGIALTKQLSIGGSLGLDYNQNLLQTPYIFQSQPVLRGFKTILNLSSSGWGANASAGILYRPVDTVSLGLSYQSRAIVKTHGEATGNAGAQLDALGPAFAGVGRDFHYNSEVDNTFPQMVSGGAAWKFLPGWETSAQVDWTNWADSFDTLPIKLSHGSNAQIDSLVGSTSLNENIPLHWKDRFSYRIGLERAITPAFFLRLGYAYSKSPVPSETLTPLTAAIPENTISAGAGYRWRWLEVDLSYQWDIPITRHVGTSSLADGEYSGSSVRASIQWVGLTAAVRF